MCALLILSIQIGWNHLAGVTERIECCKLPLKWNLFLCKKGFVLQAGLSFPSILLWLISISVKVVSWNKNKKFGLKKECLENFSWHEEGYSFMRAMIRCKLDNSHLRIINFKTLTSIHAAYAAKLRKYQGSVVRRVTRNVLIPVSIFKLGRRRTDFSLQSPSWWLRSPAESCSSTYRWLPLFFSVATCR